ncbi:hypothetical protein PRIPAC_70604 [Pristionchus pacificus]|uniref:BUD13 homolog n=1 Tax=Pristionchus pacificus TaxID=54126 RepID=A0A2A6CEZ0_PRIPA|nr:hypothetical protein PRIPAC_70604 [Pristionchus pacificus]|eukprot:PDM76676.1 hypothetical protein PRIPAC_42071 [Pristionchus pacificus]
MSAAALSKADYLKKYLSGGGSSDGTSTKKKKSKKAKPLGAGMSIVEEDAFKVVGYGAKPDLDSDMEEEIQIEAEIKSKIATTKAKFRNAFAPMDEKPVVKKEPLSRSPSPVRRKRRDSDSSPVRQQAPRKRRDSDSPPRRRTRRDSDNSPPRAAVKRERKDSDASPPRRKRRDSDASPPRKRKNSDASPPSRTRRDSDASPPRRRRDSDASPPRRNRRDSDASPPRRRKNSDSSPPRRRERDSSPPRRPRGAASPNGERRPASPKRIKEEPVDENDGQTRTLDGKKAGLQSAKDLREEGMMMRNREIEMFTQLASHISGRDAETITRQKMTGKGSKDTQEDKEKKEREASKQAELDEKYKKNWNKGMAQQQRRAEALEEAVRVAAEPWARTKDDVAMNDHLKDVIDVKEDPLAAFIMKKRQKVDIQKGRKVYPRYEGAWPPNRFGIAPGFRWDGVVRGTGFEGQLAISGNAKRAAEQEYYQNIQLYE